MSLPLHQPVGGIGKAVVFAVNSKHRIDVTPARRGKGRPNITQDDRSPGQRRTSMTWAQPRSLDDAKILHSELSTRFKLEFKILRILLINGRL